jgi:adenine-specific DNA-methyltransferase
VSRFALDEDLKDVFAKGNIKAADYRLAVAAYKNASDKTAKAALLEQIGRVKAAIYEAFYHNNPSTKNSKKLLGDRFLLENKAAVGDLFEKLKSQDISDDLGKINREVTAMETQIEELKQGKTYRNSFEWRFEFPKCSTMTAATSASMPCSEIRRTSVFRNCNKGLQSK